MSTNGRQGSEDEVDAAHVLGEEAAVTDRAVEVAIGIIHPRMT